MTIEEFISAYGYLAVAVGTFFEGETVLVIGGFAAYRGYLELPWVIVAAFIGTWLADQFYFHIGQAGGQRLLDKRPAWKAKSRRVFYLLERYEVWFIIGYRVMYGLRTVTPVIMGASNISALRFLLLDAVGVALWAGVVGTLGYLFGSTLEVIIRDARQYEWVVLVVLVLLGIAFWLYRRKKQTSVTPLPQDSGPDNEPRD